MDLRLGRNDGEGTPWSVLSDVAITIVLVLVLFLVLQFIQTYREHYMNVQLARRQGIVREAVLAAVPDTSRVRVDSLAPDRQRLTFSSEVLFRTCRADLKPEGDTLLRAVGGALAQFDTLFESVQIEGHTDTVPISRQTRDCPYGSNWELSSARATRVVMLYSGDSLVTSGRLSAIGRAEYHPVDPDSLDLNRRIEVLLQYDRSSIQAELFKSGARADRP